MSRPRILVCFAVKEEARYFRPANPDVQTILTGMGKRNAANAIRAALQTHEPAFVITAGFAGALNPRYLVGTILFGDGVADSLREKLKHAGALPGKFHCADKVAVTAAEKWELWQATGADAVEMESGVIGSICAELGIPCATIRVISDAAGEDLPLDFNALMTTEEKIDFGKLAGQIIRSPKKIPTLIKFGRQTASAAKELGRVLTAAILD